MSHKKKRSMSQPQTISVPTILELAESFKKCCDPALDLSDLNDVFTDSLLLEKNQIDIIEKQTINQANSEVWIKQRHGRLTASNFKNIVNISKKLQSDNEKKCPEYIIANVMGYDKTVMTWQMKHGINTELHAKNKYISLNKQHHQNFKYSDPGMRIFYTHPYLSATPDLEINCNCHGPGLVEIKCPASIVHLKPTVENYHHIECKDNILTLKKLSPYYSQIQGQLAATNKHYCDFFVFTFHGHLSIRQTFDQRNISSELLLGTLKNKMQNVHDENSLIPIANYNFHLDENVQEKDLTDFLLHNENMSIDICKH